MTARIFDVWKRRGIQLKMETYAIYLLIRTPESLGMLSFSLLASLDMLFSPIDKFLDSVPIVGYLDHLILVPIGVALAFKKMIPPAVLADCREKARIAMKQKKPTNRVDGSIIIFIWFLFASLAIVYTAWVMKDWGVVLKWWFGWFMKMTKLRNHMPAHGGF